MKCQNCQKELEQSGKEPILRFVIEQKHKEIGSLSPQEKAELKKYSAKISQ